MISKVKITSSLERLKSVVRAYDIRGIVPDDLDEYDAFSLGLVLGHYMKSLNTEHNIVVGMDNRKTSFNIANALCMGFNTLGIIVKNIGVVPTPVLYHEAFLSNVKQSILGVMVTASHNPIEYNGFKVVFNSKIVDGKQLIELIDRYKGYVEIERKNDEYINYIINRVNLERIEYIKNIKILWDCNNGATQPIIREITSKIPIQNDLINTESFITSQPDPTNDLNINRVKKIASDYDIAFCFDGDGDRLVIVTKNGDVLRGDKILLILAKYYAKEKKSQGEVVVVDIKTSSLIIKELEKIGFEVIVQKTGHSFIKSRMAERGAALGGEVSGHLFFQFFDENRHIPYDDAILAAFYVLKIFLFDRDLFDSAIKSIPQTFSKYDIKIKCSKAVQNDVMRYLLSYLRRNKMKFLDIDGLKFESKDGWWLVRQSNTEIALIICIESSTEAGYKKFIKFISDALEDSGLSASNPII